MTRKDILIQKAIDYVIKGKSWKTEDRRMLEIYFDKIYTEDEIERMLIGAGVIKDFKLEQYIKLLSLIYKANMDYEKFKQNMEQRRQGLKQTIDELITMEFVESLFPTDEEIEEMIKKYFKENK